MTGMQRYFLQLSFNGKNFHGWQIQQNAHTVQAEINTALMKLLGKETETIGCCRTDTGVHATMFFLHFDAGKIEDEKDFLYHLNCLLPFEIAIQKIFPVAPDAHARFDATSRTYRYYIHQVRNPFLNDTSYFFPLQLNLQEMNHAASLLLKYSDFSSFAKTRSQAKSKICKITSASWNRLEERLIFEITADRFLRNMVRAVVGTLLDVGKGELRAAEVGEIIEGRHRSAAGASVPGHGLFLEKVTFPFIPE